jgi:hypothetical protein
MRQVCGKCVLVFAVPVRSTSLFFRRLYRACAASCAVLVLLLLGLCVRVNVRVHVRVNVRVFDCFRFGAHSALLHFARFFRVMRVRMCRCPSG